MRNLVLLLGFIAVVATLGWFLFSAGESETRQVALNSDEPAASQEMDAPGVLPDLLSESDAALEPSPIADARTALSATRQASAESVLRVINTDGAPLADVLVRVLREPSSEQLEQFGQAMSMDLVMGDAPLEFESDAAGAIYLEAFRPGQKFLFEARMGELWGYLELDVSETDREYELVLSAGLRIIARVLDGNGRPLAGVPVVLETAGGNWNREVMRGVSQESSGLVDFVHVDRHAESEDGLRLRLDALALEPIVQLVNLEQPPVEPYVLTLPASGSVTVKVLDQDRGLYRGAARATLRALADGESRDISPFNSESITVVSAPVEAGLARFDLVATGFQVQAAVYREGSPIPTSVVADGPGVTGSTAQIDVRLGATNPVVRLRALGPDGNPIGNTGISVEIHLLSDHLSSKADCSPVTDDRGVFFVDLPPSGPKGQKVSLVVKSSVHGGLEGKLDLAQEMEVGVTDLGDIVLEAPKVFVGGIVTGPAGQPVERASLVVRSRGLGQSPWREMSNIGVSTDAEGRFEIYKTYSGAQFQVAASAEGFASTWTDFNVGQTNVNVGLQSEGRVTGKVLLNEGISPTLLQLTISATEDTGEYLGYRSRTVRPDADGRFSFHHLVAGKNRSIRVSARRQSKALRDIGELTVNSGETTADARCNPIDLRGALFLHNVELVQSGKGGPVNGRVGFRPAGTEAFEDSIWLDGSEFQLLTTTEAVDLSIEASGYRREVLLNQRGDVRVALREAIVVTLILPADVELPESPIHIKAGLVPVDGVGGFDYSGNAFDESREISATVGAAGKLRVIWIVEVRTVNSSMAMQKGLERKQLVDVLDTESEQRILLELTQEEMDELAKAF